MTLEKIWIDYWELEKTKNALFCRSYQNVAISRKSSAWSFWYDDFSELNPVSACHEGCIARIETTEGIEEEETMQIRQNGTVVVVAVVVDRGVEELEEEEEVCERETKLP